MSYQQSSLYYTECQHAAVTQKKVSMTHSHLKRLDAGDREAGQGKLTFYFQTHSSRGQTFPANSRLYFETRLSNVIVMRDCVQAVDYCGTIVMKPPFNWNGFVNDFYWQVPHVTTTTTKQQQKCSN